MGEIVYGILMRDDSLVNITRDHRFEEEKYSSSLGEYMHLDA